MTSLLDERLLTDCVFGGRPCKYTAIRCAPAICCQQLPRGSPQLERDLRVDRHQVARRRQRLVLVEAVRGDQFGEVAAVQPARHVMACGDGAERPGVVDETRRATEPGRLGDGAAVAADGLRRVEEPPR